MIKRFCLLLALLLFCNLFYAQNIISFSYDEGGNLLIRDSKKVKSFHVVPQNTNINDKLNLFYDFNVSVSPNPTSGPIRVIIDGKCVSESESTVSIYTISGLQMLSKKGNDIIELDITDYMPGVYVVVVEKSNYVKSVKIIKS